MLFYSIFFSQLVKMNSMQKLATVIDNRTVQIVAGPGSGKTETIAHRVWYLHEKKKIAANKFIIVTFTNKAAEELKQRIWNKVGSVAEDMWIGTFHSAAARILRQYAPSQYGSVIDLETR